MSVVAFVSSRVSSTSMSTSRSLTRASSSRRKTATSAPADIRYLSAIPNNSKQESSSSSFSTSVLFGLSVAGAATFGASSLDYEMKSHTFLSQCEPDVLSTPHQSSYMSLTENIKTLLWSDHNEENLKIPLGRGGELRFEPTTTTSSTSIPIPGRRVIDAVKASVDTASEWEKKAKETVMMMTRPYPKIYDVSVRALKGSRLAMEDKYAIHNDGRFTAVFDGHGGGCVSKYLSETLFDKITHHLKKKQAIEKNDISSLENLTQAITASFQEVEKEILEINDYQYQGSTAVAVMVHEDEAHGRTIVSANVGDSRAVLSHKRLAVNLTKDHKPDDYEEKKRIMAMGEKIEWDSYCNVYRVCNLSLSRAIGDKFAKPAVSSEVDIKLHPINDSDTDDFIVLASDGLWDVMSSQDCVDYVNERLNPSKEQMKSMSAVEAQRLKFSKRKNMSRFVANEALRRGSSDNVCVIIVWLNKLE